MKIATFLFALTISSSAVFAQSGDPAAAERFRMKFGRDIAAQSQSRTPKAVKAADPSVCSCCRHKRA